MNIIVLTILAILIIFQLPFKNIKTSFFRLIDNVNDFINDFNFIIFDKDTTSSDNYINSVFFFKADDNYFAEIEFKNFKAEDIEFIKINNYNFNSFILKQNNNKTIIVDISNIISNKDSTNISISTIKVNTRIYESSISTVYYKDVDYNIILERQKSIVGISTSRSGLIFETSSIWGSGIIFNKLQTTKLDLFNNPVVVYEYLILTNYHVIENGVSFKIHYESYGNQYPKSFRDSVELLGYNNDQTDLAILKLTTRDGSLVSLEDEQFTTKVLVPLEEKQLVFGIGSPSVDGDILFNSYKVGKIINTNATVGKLKDSDLCIDGCRSIQTTSFQGEGSSGGGVFDLDGNLIGIHFAGNSEHKQSFEIPMAEVLYTIELILGSEYMLKRSPNLDFFFLLKLIFL